MAIQIIVYSVTTGRIRHVADPEVEVTNVAKYHAMVPVRPGEASLVYTKKGLDANGNGQDHVYSWQAAINQVSGKSVTPGVDANDTWFFADANGLIYHVQHACPVCGDPNPQMMVAGIVMAQGPYAVGGTLSGGTRANGILTGATYTPPHV